MQAVELEQLEQPRMHAEHFPLLTKNPELHVVQLPKELQAVQLDGQVTLQLAVDVKLYPELQVVHKVELEQVAQFAGH